MNPKLKSGFVILGYFNWIAYIIMVTVIPIVWLIYNIGSINAAYGLLGDIIIFIIVANILGIGVSFGMFLGGKLDEFDGTKKPTNQEEMKIEPMGFPDGVVENDNESNS